MATEISPAMAQRLELWPLERLAPHDRNPQTHPPEQIAALRASIQRFGFNAPILVSSEDGILAGHGRLIAARELGMSAVPVVVLDHLTAEQREAYLLADNQISRLAGSDDQLLAEMLNDLLASNVSLEGIGFSDDDLARLNDGLELGAFQDVAVTERAEPEHQQSLGMDRDAEAEAEDSSAESGEVEEEGPDRGMALAIVLTPQEMKVWRNAKEELGYSTDKAAFWKLVEDFMEELS